MRGRLLGHWERLRESFWFVPALMAVAAAALALGLGWVDRTLSEGWVSEAEWVYSGSAEGARSLLSTLASAMITVAGVVFSTTVVALTLASTQLGPRLLRNFMRDAGNQVTLGTFIATFLYCLLVVRMVRGSSDGAAEFVPHVSVSIAIVLALLSLGVFIYFIHHAAASMQASNVIAAVGTDLDHAIDRLFPERLGTDAGAEEVADPAAPAVDGRDHESQIFATCTGYVQMIDDEAIMALARQRDVVVRVMRRPGHFVAPHLPLASVRPAAQSDDALADAVRDVFVVGSQLTLAQNVEFAIDQLVEVAVRALSPGVNDPFTAIQCIQRLGAALARLAERRIPTSHRLDAEGRLRVIAHPWTFGGLLDAAFDQIRRHGRTNVAVSMALLEAIAAIAPVVRRPADREALLRQARMIEAHAGQAVPEPHDRADLRSRFEAVTAALGRAC